MKITALFSKYPAVRSEKQVEARPRYLSLLPACLALILALQLLRLLPSSWQFYLLPGIAILAVAAASFFNYGGAVTALAANLSAGTALFSLKSEGGELAFGIICVLLVCSSAAAVIIAAGKEQEKTDRQNLEWLSVIDCLTEVYNHRFFQQRLAEELARAGRTKSPLALAFVDIDNFKRYNDLNGHLLGDTVLKKTASFLREKTRIHDVVCRYGGDEFVIILPETDLESATVIASRLVKTYALQEMPGRSKSDCSLTLSIGLSAYPRPGRDKQELIRQADSALYLCKEEGRNRARAFSEERELSASPGNDFCFNRCRNSLIEGYRVSAGRGAEQTEPGGNGKKAGSNGNGHGRNGNGSGNGNNGKGHADRNLLVGKALGLGHLPLDRGKLTGYIEQMRLN